jgi:hypothetical protein
MLVSRVPSDFSHVGLPCGWPDLAATCPDCGREGDLCSFFSENEEESACRGFSRLVVLALRCQLDAGKRRLETQIRQRVIVLSGGEGSQRAVSFATGHARTYKDSLKIVDGVWLPQDVSSPDTEFYWDRSGIPWRFSLLPRTGAETVTMKGLLSLLGIQADADPTGEAPDVATLAAQVSEMRQMLLELQTLVKDNVTGAAPRNGSTNPAEAAGAAAETLRQAQWGGGWNPSQVFNLAGAHSSVSIGQGADVEMVRTLMQAGASAEQIVRVLQAKSAPPAPMEHRTAWLQALEGTSPLCVYTGMHGDTRQSATPKTFTVQTYDSAGSKLTQKITAWPPANPEAVAVFRLQDLGIDWKRGLVQGNLRLLQITPVADRSLTPSIPVDVDAFLGNCFACLHSYAPAAVLRAWEATHHFMIDEYVSKRSRPQWDNVWMMPVFQVHLKGSASPMPKMADGAFDVTKCCISWNLRQGRKCVKNPEADCTKSHICMRCGGGHRAIECTRE